MTSMPLNIYMSIHIWLKHAYGKANKCENESCTKLSNKYEWSKLKEKNHAFDRDNYWMLCVGCHRKYDATFSSKRIENTISKVIKKLRLHLAFDKDEFSQIIGADFSDYILYESAKKLPSIKVLRTVKEIYDKQDTCGYLTCNFRNHIEYIDYVNSLEE